MALLRRDQRRLLGLAVVLAAVLAVLAVGVRALDTPDPVALRGWVLGFGPWAPVAFVALGAVHVIVAPIPAQPVVLAGGYLFGPVAGTAYSLLGATVGSAVVIWLSRRYGRRYVENTVSRDTLESFDALSQEHALTAVFVGFLVPGLPDDLLCVLAGVTERPVWSLLAAAALGRLPSYVVMSLVGAELAEQRLLSAAALAAVVLAAAVVGYRYREQLARVAGVR